jgi:signal transduction histidine kinase
MKQTLFTLLFFFSTSICLAQTNKTDSLKHLAHSASPAKSRLHYLLDLCAENETLPEDTLWSYALKAKALAVRLKDDRSLSLAVLAQANAYIRWNNPDSANALITPELSKYKASDPATRSIYFKLAGARIDLMIKISYKDVLTQVYAVLRQAEFYNDSLTKAESMNTIGALDYDMDRLPQGKNWLYKALSFTTASPVLDNTNASICLNLADNYWWTDKEDSAMYFVNKAERLSTRSQNVYLLSVASQKRAVIYLKTGQYGKAEQAILKSLQLIEKVEGKAPQQDKLLVLASVYEYLQKYDKAINVLNQGRVMDSLYKIQAKHSLHRIENSDFQTMFYDDELAKCYKLKGDSKNYAAVLEKIITEKDSIYKMNSASAIAELETNYKVKENEAMIVRQKLELTRQNYLFYGSTLVVSLSAVILWLLYSASRRRQMLLAARAVAEAEESERKRISADLHDNLGAQLSFIKRNVAFLIDRPEGFKPSDERRYLDYLNDFARDAMIDLRETIWVLNKEEVFVRDFADKLKFYLRQQLHGAENISWEFRDRIDANWKLSSSEVMHLFRIVQELVNNAIRHSQASRITIEFKGQADQHYQLEVQDNGCGFDTGDKRPGHYGLNNLRQRAKELAAELEIASDPELGTRIVLKK